MLRTILAAGLLAIGAPTLAQSSVTVTMTNFHFTPMALKFHHGQAYTLRIVNATSSGHSFAAPEFLAASTMTAAERAKAPGGKVELSGGESAELHLTAPARPGSYKLKCSHFLHASFGMTGEIAVD
jgi:uncharacterized cupredoxin-like copper-binding protein